VVHWDQWDSTNLQFSRGNPTGSTRVQFLSQTRRRCIFLPTRNCHTNNEKHSLVTKCHNKNIFSKFNDFSLFQGFCSYQVQENAITSPDPFQLLPIDDDAAAVVSLK